MDKYIGLLALGYLIGSIPFGYIVSVAHGIAINKVGSGSSGSTNIMRALGKKWGFLVMAFDMFKGATIILIAVTLGHTGMFFAVALFATALGHAYPLFLGFRGGGKSVNTIVGGMILLASPYPIIISATVWLLLYAIQNAKKKFVMSRTNLAVLVPAIPFGLGVTYMSLWWGFIGLGFSAFLLWTHRENIKRLLCGEEKPLEIK